MERATIRTKNLKRLLLALVLFGGEAMQGFAPRYDPGVMEGVNHNRDLPVVDCMISSAYYDVGDWVYVYSVNLDHYERCRVTDVSHPKDVTRHRRLKRIVELGYNEARRLCGVRYMEEPPTKCPVIVFKFDEK